MSIACDKAMIQSYFNSLDHWLCSGGYIDLWQLDPLVLRSIPWDVLKDYSSGRRPLRNTVSRRHVGGHWHCGGPVCIWLTTTFRHAGKPWNQSLVGFPMTKTRRELCPVTLLLVMTSKGNPSLLTPKARLRFRPQLRVRIFLKNQKLRERRKTYLT